MPESSQSMSNQKFKQSSENLYYSYDNIPFRIYCSIVETKDTTLLCKSGKPNKQLATKQWEKIVKAVEKDNNSFWYDSQLEDATYLKDSITEYVLVKAMLNRLLHKYSKPLVNELRELGYVISTQNSTKYAETLYQNLRAVNNLITKITIKNNELILQNKQAEKSGNTSFDISMVKLR